MKEIKEEKGITLLALIITILMLLILATVAITSMQETDIIGYAENAASKYNSTVQNEQSAFQKYEEFLKENAGSLTENDPDIDLIEKYVLGAEKKGRDLTEIATVSGTSITEFKDEESTIADASTTMTELFCVSETKRLNYAKYNNKVYRIVSDYDTNVTEDVEMVYKPEGREGRTVQYDSDGDETKESWVILTDRDGKVEIVSSAVMGSLWLGDLDTSVSVTTDIDGDGTKGNNGDKAILSYNNAITTINNYCKSLVTATDNEGVRSVGGTDNSFTPYSSTNYNELGSEITVDVASGDFHFEKDIAKMFYHGIINSGSSSYWIASRDYVDDGVGYVNFRIRIYSESVSGAIIRQFIFQVNSEKVTGGGQSYGVRPVVINPEGI